MEGASGKVFVTFSLNEEGRNVKLNAKLNWKKIEEIEQDAKTVLGRLVSRATEGKDFYMTVAGSVIDEEGDKQTPEYVCHVTLRAGEWATRHATGRTLGEAFQRLVGVAEGCKTCLECNAVKERERFARDRDICRDCVNSHRRRMSFMPEPKVRRLRREEMQSRRGG